MDSEIIYENKYPQKGDMAEITKYSDTEKPSFDEIIKGLHGEVKYKLIHEHLTSSEDFIRESIEIAELYKFDIRIEHRVDCIRTLLSFDCCDGLRHINRLFGIADQVSFFKNTHERDITVFLDFYTHTVTR